MRQENNEEIKCLQLGMSWLTSTLVSHWTVGNVATFGDGNGSFNLDSRCLSSVWKHYSTKTTWLLAHSLHLKAATVWHSSFLILCCFCTRSQLHCFIVWGRFSTFPRSLNPSGNTQKHKQSQKTDEFKRSLHISGSQLYIWTNWFSCCMGMQCSYSYGQLLYCKMNLNSMPSPLIKMGLALQQETSWYYCSTWL